MYLVHYDSRTDEIVDLHFESEDSSEFKKYDDTLFSDIHMGYKSIIDDSLVERMKDIYNLDVVDEVKKILKTAVEEKS